jgi:hypothetical protein
MSLQNLLKIGALAEHVTDAEQVNRMLASAGRCSDDSRQPSISLKTRLDAAYRAVMQVSMVALWANGLRPSKSAPGHHRTMIQSLHQSVGLDNDRMLVLDTFRVKRNAIDYTGEDVDAASVESCTEAADHLLQHLNQWLAENRPDLLR